MLDDKSKISALPTFDGEYSANLDSVVIREPMPCEDRILRALFGGGSARRSFEDLLLTRDEGCIISSSTHSDLDDQSSLRRYFLRFRTAFRQLGF